MNGPLTSFENHLPRWVITGRGACDSFAGLCQTNAWERVFLVSDAGVAGAGLTQKVSQRLLDPHLLAGLFGEVPPEAPLDVVDTIAKRMKASCADVVIALGGGSVMDAAKVAALCAGQWKTAREGSFFPPTVLAGVPDEMRVAREAIFGPIIPLLRYESVTEAVRRANETPYGLASYVYGRDLEQCRAMPRSALRHGGWHRRRERIASAQSGDSLRRRQAKRHRSRRRRGRPPRVPRNPSHLHAETRHLLMKLRSERWWNDRSNPGMTALYLERFLNYGLTPGELQSARPVIGIAQSAIADRFAYAT
jgi:hypothetical protein